MRDVILKLSSGMLALVALAGSFWFYTSKSFSQATTLSVIMARQPDSPLLIRVTYVDSSNPLQPRYGYSITNISDKPIRAYTIQESVNLNGGAPITGTAFSQMAAVKQFLIPNDSRQEEGGLGSIYKSRPTNIELAVDFVEFADNTRWGSDESHSGERLDGIRAGGKAAIKKYREVLASGSAIGLEQALANPNLIRPASQPQSDRWAEGFKIGVSIVKSRLERAKAKNGQAEVERELSKPFDSTEGRQEP